MAPTKVIQKTVLWIYSDDLLSTYGDGVPETCGLFPSFYRYANIPLINIWHGFYQ